MSLCSLHMPWCSVMLQVTRSHPQLRSVTARRLGFWVSLLVQSLRHKKETKQFKETYKKTNKYRNSCVFFFVWSATWVWAWGIAVFFTGSIDGSQTDFRLCDDSKAFSVPVLKGERFRNNSVNTNKWSTPCRTKGVWTFQRCSSQSLPTLLQRETAEFGRHLL